MSATPDKEKSMNITKFSGGVPGVTDNIGERVYSMLADGRRYFGSAGASLTQHANNLDYQTEFSRSHVRAGLEAERDTSRRIREWMTGKPNAVLADSVHIVGAGKEVVDEETGLREGGDTDHVLILGNTVVIIDTKCWKSRRKYTVTSKGTVQRSGRSFPGGSRLHAGQARFLWQKYLVKPARVISLVCINADKVFVPFDANWRKQPFRLITIERLTETLDWFYSKLSEHDKQTINTDLVAQTIVCCVKPYDAYQRVFNKEALRQFH